MLLLLLPSICTRAVEDSDALALQVGLSTVAVFVAMVAGFAGLRAGAAEGDLGAASEWRAAPLGAGHYVLGRFLGILAAATALFLALAPFLAWPQRAALLDDPPAAASAAAALAALALAAAQFAALGLLLAAITTPQLAAVSFVAVVVATRTVVPELASRSGVGSFVAALLPDPARLDFTRELAFHRPIDSTSTALACLAAAAHAAACLVAAAWALRRRET